MFFRPLTQSPYLRSYFFAVLNPPVLSLNSHVWWPRCRSLVRQTLLRSKPTYTSVFLSVLVTSQREPFPCIGSSSCIPYSSRDAGSLVVQPRILGVILGLLPWSHCVHLKTLLMIPHIRNLNWSASLHLHFAFLEQTPVISHLGWFPLLFAHRGAPQRCF